MIIVVMVRRNWIFHNWLTISNDNVHVSHNYDNRSILWKIVKSISLLRYGGGKYYTEGKKWCDSASIWNTSNNAHMWKYFYESLVQDGQVYIDCVWVTTHGKLYDLTYTMYNFILYVMLTTCVFQCHERATFYWPTIIIILDNLHAGGHSNILYK